MNSKLSSTSIVLSLSRFFHRYHIIIFVILVLGSLSAAVLMLNDVVALSDKRDGYTSTVKNSSFDTETMDRLKSLKDPGEPTVPLVITGRSNPLSE